jgi:hypothetical protein
LTSDLGRDNGIPLNLKGIYVDRITENGPAGKAGIHGSTTDQYLNKHLGDVIIAIDEHNKLSINLSIYESGPNDVEIEDVLYMEIQILNLSPIEMIFSTMLAKTRLQGTTSR